MNYKSLILTALLVPSLGYGIDKEEQKKQIIEKMDELEIKLVQVDEELMVAAFWKLLGEDTSVSHLIKKRKSLAKEIKIIAKKMKSLGIESDHE